MNVSNPDYLRQLTESILNMFINVSIMIIFSLFAAVLLNTGVLLITASLIIMYLFVQRYFVESVGRAGIVR